MDEDSRLAHGWVGREGLVGVKEVTPSPSSHLVGSASAGAEVPAELPGSFAHSFSKYLIALPLYHHHEVPIAFSIETMQVL